MFFILSVVKKQIAISIKILINKIIKYFCHWKEIKEEVNNLRKETFYIHTKVFEKGLTASEMCVYFYLCSCANKDGICFPTRRKIGNATGRNNYKQHRRTQKQKTVDLYTAV